MRERWGMSRRLEQRGKVTQKWLRIENEGIKKYE